MPEQGAVAGLLLAAVLASSAGMGWLALSMQVHARQAWDATPSSATMRALRWMGVAGIVIALVLCLRAADVVERHADELHRALFVPLDAVLGEQAVLGAHPVDLGVDERAVEVEKQCGERQVSGH